MAASDNISAEDRLIARFFGPIVTHPGALGLSDDAAFIKPPAGCDLVLKTDGIVDSETLFAFRSLDKREAGKSVDVD